MHHNIAIITLIASTNALMLESKLEAKFLGKVGEIGEAILKGGEEAVEILIEAPSEYLDYQKHYIEQVEPLAKAIEEQRAAKAAKCSDAKPAVGEKFRGDKGLVNFT